MFQRLELKSEAEWLEARREVLTATEIPVILGLNKWKTVKQLQAGKEHREDLSNNAYVLLGQWLEPFIVNAVNYTLKSSFTLFEQGKAFYVNPALGLGATPDAYDTHRLLECKSTKPRNYVEWASWPPLYYLMQLYTQLYCTDRQEGLLAILSTDLSQKNTSLNLRLSIHSIGRNARLDDILVSETQRYWKTVKEDKMFRVNRKLTKEVEYYFRVKGKIIC